MGQIPSRFFFLNIFDYVTYPDYIWIVKFEMKGCGTDTESKFFVKILDYVTDPDYMRIFK